MVFFCIERKFTPVYCHLFILSILTFVLLPFAGLCFLLSKMKWDLAIVKKVLLILSEIIHWLTCQLVDQLSGSLAYAIHDHYFFLNNKTMKTIKTIKQIRTSKCKKLNNQKWTEPFWTLYLFNDFYGRTLKGKNAQRLFWQKRMG